jgi:hypothetical protein
MLFNIVTQLVFYHYNANIEVAVKAKHSKLTKNFYALERQNTKR